MRRLHLGLTTLAVLTFSANVAAQIDATAVAQSLWQAKQQQQAWPTLLSGQGASSKQAYQVQVQYRRLAFAQQKISGYKAGLTGLGSWNKFGLTEPLSGVLFESQQLSQGELKLEAGLKFEAELAFRLAQDIRQAPQNVSELKSLIDAIAPAIELPSLRFKARPQGIDVIAVNASAYKYYLGPWLAADNIPDLKPLTVSISCNGEMLQSAKGESVYGDPWAAALWLVQQQLKLGNDLKAGQVLLTGAVGKMLTPKACEYELDFQSLGRLRLKLS